MFERPKSGELAILVHVSPGTSPDQDEINEFIDLATSAGADIQELVLSSRRQPDPRSFVGKGKAEEIAELIDTTGAELVIFDHELSPSQERNLEALFKCRVLDRTGLILDIFAQRARSFEGKLQVELAQLRHLSTRLVRGWTHLERQKGGIGLRGPGETQLETDRRLLNQRIDQIRHRLQRVVSQREQGRRSRKRAEIPTVSLVGYTNAGKSTLFNALTNAGVYAQDQLFATLDPTLRRVQFPDGNAMVLADTVGFISKLPHELVAAFKSTLQETVEASLLLHVVDAASHQRAEQMAEVESVLSQIGADEVPMVEVFNKLDLVPGQKPQVEYDADGALQRVWCSASTGEGVEALVEALQGYFRETHVNLDLTLGPTQGGLRARLYRVADVLEDKPTDLGGWQMRISMPEREYQRLKKSEQLPVAK
ncbi:MAG: ribosome rescue GTPase HflX [bacterium]